MMKKLLAWIGGRKKSEMPLVREDRHMGWKLANVFGGELENSLSHGFYWEYEEVPNGFGGYNTVNVHLVKLSDPAFRRCIVNHTGEIQNFPGFRDEDWKADMEFPIDSTVRFVFSIGPYRGGKACVRWVMQPDGRYFEDEDGFGAEHCEEVEMFSFLDEEGRFTEPFCTKAVYRWRQENEPGFPQPGVPDPDRQAELTEEQKRRVAYTPRNLKAALVKKLSQDPGYARMCMFCTNALKLTADRLAQDAEKGTKRFRYCFNFDNLLKMWDRIPFVHLDAKKQDDGGYALWVRVPFSIKTDRVLGIMMYSGTMQEVADFMQSEKCGPLLMQCLDEINETLRDQP